MLRVLCYGVCCAAGLVKAISPVGWQYVMQYDGGLVWWCAERV